MSQVGAVPLKGGDMLLDAEPLPVEIYTVKIPPPPGVDLTFGKIFHEGSDYYDTRSGHIST